MASSKTRKVLQLQEKVDLLKQSNSGAKVQELAKKFDIGKTQVYDILKNKKKIIEHFQNGGNAKRKVMTTRTSKFEVINEQVFDWFTSARSRNIPLSGPLIKEKAKALCEEAGIQDFCASNGWLQKWKKCYNIGAAVLSGESASVDETVVEEWKSRLDRITEGYSLENIFNADETGFFYRLLPKNSLVQKGTEKCSGGKHSKERMTVLLCVSSTGEKLKPLVIGKAAKPRCFKHLDRNSLPVQYFSNRKAWMTASIFSEWLNSLNNKMQIKCRRILILVDNCSAHPELKLSNIKVVFLPPNTTSRLQPLDAGIIQAVKLIYRKSLVRHLLFLMGRQESSSDSSELAKTVSILEAIRWISKAWDQLPKSTIQKCFGKCGFSIPSASEEEPEQELTEAVSSVVIPGGVSLQEMADMDADLATHDCAEEPNTRADSSSEGEDNTQDPEESSNNPKPISYFQAVSHVHELWTFALEHNLPSLTGLVEQVKKTMADCRPQPKLRQTSILNFMSKN